MNRKTSLFCAVAVAALSAFPAFAQDVQPAQHSGDNGGQLEEIIVTAQKRSENAQNVPIAVSSVRADALDAAGVRSVLDLRVAVPTINLTNSNGYLTSNIRGVGSIGVGPGVENAVSLYIDGVYIASAYATALSLNNIEAVDVLKGPQGTLFGRNATGGLVQVTTRTPGSTPSGKFEAGYANYGVVSGSAYLSGGLSDTLFADIAFAGKKQSDGWGKNRTTGADVYKNDGDFSVRSKWLFEPGVGTKITLIGDYSRAKGSLNAAAVRPGTRSAFLAGTPIAPDLGYDLVNDQPISQTAKAWGASLRADQDIGAVRLTSITALRKGKLKTLRDSDFSPANLASFSFIQNDRQISQELQLSSNDSGSRLKWTAGFYYYDAHSNYDPLIVRLDFINRFTTTLITEDVESEAAYGQATYEIADATNLTLGARYTHERRDEKDVSITTTTISTGVSTNSTTPNQSISFNKLTFRAALDHRFSDEALGYISFNRGFKSGGFGASTPGAAPYRPETLDAYEAGLKTDLLDRRLRLNLSGFYYKYRDMQILAVVTGNLINLINAGAANIYGADLDMTAKLGRNFTLTAGLGWLHPNFDKYAGCKLGDPLGGRPFTFGSCAGKQLPLASKFVGNVALNYTADVGNGKLSASANAYYNDGYVFEPDNVVRQPDFVQLGSSVKWTSQSGLSVGVFGKNLTNRRVITYGPTASNGTQVVAYAEPRTYGVTLGYEF